MQVYISQSQLLDTSSPWRTRSEEGLGRGGGTSGRGGAGWGGGPPPPPPTGRTEGCFSLPQLEPLRLGVGGGLGMPKLQSPAVTLSPPDSPRHACACSGTSLRTLPHDPWSPWQPHPTPGGPGGVLETLGFENCQMQKVCCRVFPFRHLHPPGSLLPPAASASHMGSRGRGSPPARLSVPLHTLQTPGLHPQHPRALLAQLSSNV